MKKTKLRIFAAVLAVVTAFSLFGCGNAGGGRDGDDPDARGKLGVEVWSAPVTEKIMRDKKYENRGPASVSIEMYKNETESGQLIFTPDKAVKSYNFEVNGDLTAADGSKLEAKNIEIYHEMYMNVESNTVGNGTRGFDTGWYPDPLLPMKTAVKYGENHVNKNENQGVYVTVTTPEVQPAGTYTGVGKLTADGKEISVPISVTVWDWTVPTENHLRTVFASGTTWNDGNLKSGELDSTWEKQEEYTNYLLKYRLNNRLMPYAIMGSSTTFEVWIPKLVEYAKDVRVSTIVMPYRDTGTSINTDYYGEVVRNVMKACIENDIDIFKKLVTYFELMDEPNGNEKKMDLAYNSLKDVAEFNKRTRNTKEQFRKPFENLDGYDEVKFDVYFRSMLNIEQLLVGYYIEKDARFLGDNLKELNITYCPTADKYNDEKDRNKYYGNDDTLFGDEREFWWYTCVVPKNPYPSYHIDDWGWSPRVLGWQQYKYGVTGNLYWTVDYWYNNVTGTVQNLYEVPMEYAGANGDGFLWYPGKYYGLSEPVGSVRINAIRDGMEDYEAMYALGNLTDAQLLKAGIVTQTELDSRKAYEGTVRNVLSDVFDTLFRGTIINTDAEKLNAARRVVAQMLTAASSTGVTVYDKQVQGDKYDYKIFVPDGTTVTVDGEYTVTDAPDADEGKIYTVTVDSSVDDAALRFTAVKDGKSVDITVSTGAKNKTFETETLKNALKATAGAQIETLGNAITVTFTGDKTKYFSINGSLFDGLDMTKATVIFKLTATEDTDIKVQVLGTNPTAPIMTVLEETLGANTEKTVTASLMSVDWARLGSLDSVRVLMGNGGEFSVTISDFIVAQ